MTQKKLKASIYKVLLSLTLLQLIVFTAYSAPAEEFSKKIKKEFDINSDALLRLNSKYGKIDCKNWDKNIISIEVTIEVEAANKEKADEIFEKINIDVKGTESIVEATTVFDKSVFSLIKNKKSKLKVNYEIFFPKTISLDILHKYGELFVADVNGKAMLELSYGTININEINANNNSLQVAYCKGSIGEFGGGDINIKYSTLHLDECLDANINSKYSTLLIDEADYLIFDSGYDQIKIDEIKKLNVKSQFSGFEIDELEKRLEIDIAYGSFGIDEISADFEEITIKNSYANVKLGINEDASYFLYAELKYGSLKFTENDEYLSKQIVSSTSSLYEGRIGKDKNTTSKVTIKSKHAKVSIGN